MSMTHGLLLMMACRPGPGTTASTNPLATSGDTGTAPHTDASLRETGGAATGATGVASSATGTASSATGHTGDDDPWEPPLSGVLPPTTLIEAPADPYPHLWGQYILGVPVEGDDDVLIAASFRLDYDKQPVGSYFLTGPFPRGTVALDDVWDGVSGWEPPIGNIVKAVHRVPDANGDGVEDYWLLNRLVPGPLMGRLHRYLPVDGDDSIAYIEGADVGSGYIQAANFDADGDGIDDVLIGNGEGQYAYVRWGPFLGEVSYSDPTHDPLGGYLGNGQCQDVAGSLHIPDFYGPGVDAIVYGGVDFPNWCNGADSAFFAMTVQPGEANTERLAVLEHGGRVVRAVGDINGDGTPDIFWGTTSGDSYLLPGPQLGETPSLAELEALDLLPVEGGGLSRPLGDINGDGTTDFLAVFPQDVDFRVFLSPFDPPLRQDRGLPVEGIIVNSSPSANTFATGDFDNDGLGDVAYQQPWGVYPIDLDQPGVLIVYTGADLVATWQARGLDSPADTGITDTATH